MRSLSSRSAGGTMLEKTARIRILPQRGEILSELAGSYGRS